MPMHTPPSHPPVQRSYSARLLCRRLLLRSLPRAAAAQVKQIDSRRSAGSGIDSTATPRSEFEATSACYSCLIRLATRSFISRFVRQKLEIQIFLKIFVRFERASSNARAARSAHRICQKLARAREQGALRLLMCNAWSFEVLGLHLVRSRVASV